MGKRLESHDRREIADELRNQGEFHLAQQVDRRECIDSRDLRHLRDVLENTLHKQEHYDYRLRDCPCDSEDY